MLYKDLINLQSSQSYFLKTNIYDQTINLLIKTKFNTNKVFKKPFIILDFDKISKEMISNLFTFVYTFVNNMILHLKII